jgi:eukaryotic-like serine/threonine-protein kinase
MWGMKTVRTMLAGRYRLADVIGRGGMSAVYRATDAVLGRTVAVKVLSAALAEEDPVWVTRFEREARAAASLTHTGVATVYDIGVEDGMRFIVMEYVRGRSLATILTDEAPLEPARAVEIGAQVADVLTAAHAAGIVHRDIKPGNVMVAPDAKVKVLDFGIARAAGSTALTQTVSVLGTAAYMAPEQAAGQSADARSDIYSLGCVLYAMLAGSPPFAGEVAAAVLHQHVNAAPRPLHEIAPAVPRPLEALVHQMLAKSPDARPQSAREVRDRLRSSLDPTAPTAVVGRAGPGVAAGAGLAASAGAGMAGAGVAAARAGAAAGAGAAGADARRPRARQSRARAPVPPTARTQRLAHSRSAGAGRGLALAAVALLVLVLAAIAIASIAGSGKNKAGNGRTTVPHTTSAPKASSPATTTRPPATTTRLNSSTTTTNAPAKPPPPPKTKAKPPGHGGPPPGHAKEHGPGAGGGGDGGDGGGGGGHGGDGGD